MLRRITLAALLSTAPLAGLLAAQAVQLEPFVRDQVAEAADAGLDQLWTRAMGLRDLARSENAELDPILDRILGSDEELSDRAVLLLAAARLQGEDLDGALVVDALRGVVETGADAEAAAAADLLGDRRLKTVLDDDARTSLAELLLAAADDASRTPDLRLSAARAVYALGAGRQKADARQHMRAFLESADPVLRAQGALALGSIGEQVSGPLQAELERLAALPGPAGQLAASYIKQEDIKRAKEDRYRRLDRLYERKVLDGDLQTLNSVLRMVQGMHLEGDRVDREDLIDAAIDGMLRAMDEHSSFMDSEVYERFNQDLEAEYGGIGAYVGIDEIRNGGDGLFTITRPIYSGPAYRAGLVTDDKIVQIDQWPTIEHGLSRPIDEIIKRLKGRPGTTVRLYVWRRGMDPAQIERPTEDMVVEIERAQIEIPSVQYEMLPGGIGLISLSGFSRLASTEVARAVQILSQEGLRGLVFDLRNNNGGLLTEAANVADIFLDEDLKVVSTNSRVGRSQELYTRGPALVPADVPVAVLINRYSASAAEIVSGALQDHHRATLVGERSFGKGSVQTLEIVEGTYDDEFDDENGNHRFDNWERILVDHDGDGQFDFAPRVKLTIAEYLLPSGRSIHRKVDEEGNLLAHGGVEPDVEVALPRVEAWRWEERLRLRDERAARQYVDEHWDAHQELFRQLAHTDGKDTSLYPDFEPFLAGLHTTLPRDDVRRILRAEIRRRVQDERGAEFPFGEFQEDRQVQVAIAKVLEQLDQTPADVDAFRAVFEDLEHEPDSAPLVAARLPDDLAETRDRVNAALEGDGQLSREDLDRVLSILSSLGENQ